MGVIEDATELVGLIKKVGDADLYRRIVKLEGEVIELTRANRNADEKITELERALKFSKEMRIKDGLYWAEGDESPFCTACWDARRLAIRLKRLPFLEKGHRFQCPHCQALYANRSGAIS